MKKSLRKLSMALTVVMVMLAFAVPAAAGQENGREQRNVPTSEIQYLDAEVQVIAGQPVIVLENEEGYVHVPFALSGDVFVDGRAVPVRLQGNRLVVPTEDGSMVVPLEEFEVVFVGGGQMVLVAEENPFILFVIAGAVAGGVAGVSAGAAVAAVPALVLTKKAATAIIITGGVVGAAGGAAGGAAIAPR